MDGSGSGYNLGNTNKTNLIVNYLPQHLTDEEFINMFSSYGELKSCKICRNKATNYSYGFGFADFYDPNAAFEAQKDLNGMQLAHKQIKVAFSRPAEESVKGSNVYVRNLPKHYGDEEVRELFCPYGDIIHVKILRDSLTQESKTVGFVLYDKKEMADEAIKNLNGFCPLGASECLLVKRPDEEKRKQNSTNSSLHYQKNLGWRPMGMRHDMPTSNGPITVFVYNLGTNCTEAEVYRLFSPYGALQKVDLIMDHEANICKGYAFVTYYNPQPAEMAIMNLNGFRYNGRQLQVRYKK